MTYQLRTDDLSARALLLGSAFRISGAELRCERLRFKSVTKHHHSRASALILGRADRDTWDVGSTAGDTGFGACVLTTRDTTALGLGL